MPPKKSTTTVKKAKPPPAAISRKPLTTQGKIIKAQRDAERAKKNKPREAPPQHATIPKEGDPTNASSPQLPQPPPNKKSKARSFAPPDELEELAREREAKEAATARRLTSKNDCWNFSKNKPITTREKLDRAKAIERAKGGVDSAPILNIAKSSAAKVLSLGELQVVGDAMGEKAPETKGARYGLRLDQPKVPGAYSMLQYHSPIAIVPTRSKTDENGVLMRRTARAKTVSSMIDRTSQGGKGREAKVKGRPKSSMELLKFPEEVRHRIWGYAVVEDKCFIWPASPIGREQPDLAMTCREIRKEVLSVYYGQNTFAMMISPEAQALQKELIQNIEVGGCAKSTTKPLVGFASLQKWALVMESGGWLKKIKSFAFDYVSPEASMPLRKQEGDVGDGSFIVYIKFPGRGALKGDEVAVSHSSNPKVEVHKEGACILSGWNNCSRCFVQRAPAEAVGAVMELHGNGGLRPQSIRELAKRLKRMISKLQAAKCSRKY